VKSRNWVFWLLASLLFLGATLAYALSRDLVALVGLPLGFLFGFFLHKGDLCGVLVGMGAWFANGCVIGNILSGWALMSVGLLLFGAATILSNWAVTRVYLMGGARVSRPG